MAVKITVTMKKTMTTTPMVPSLPFFLPTHHLTLLMASGTKASPVRRSMT